MDLAECWLPIVLHQEKQCCRFQVVLNELQAVVTRWILKNAPAIWYSLRGCLREKQILVKNWGRIPVYIDVDTLGTCDDALQEQL